MLYLIEKKALNVGMLGVLLLLRIVSEFADVLTLIKCTIIMHLPIRDESLMRWPLELARPFPGAKSCRRLGDKRLSPLIVRLLARSNILHNRIVVRAQGSGFLDLFSGRVFELARYMHTPLHPSTGKAA